MNTQNVGSLEACKRLLDAGIVLETDCYWHFNNWKYEWQLKYRDYFIENWGLVPAPSMAEVWRELPEEYDTETRHLELQVDKIKRVDGVIVTSANYIYDDTENGCCVYKFFAKENPTDALIDLLVWLKGAGK